MNFQFWVEHLCFQSQSIFIFALGDSSQFFVHNIVCFLNVLTNEGSCFETFSFETKIITLNVTGLEGIVRQLIDNGADINAVNYDKNSALILAILSGKYYTILMFLLKISFEKTKTFFLSITRKFSRVSTHSKRNSVNDFSHPPRTYLMLYLLCTKLDNLARCRTTLNMFWEDGWDRLTVLNTVCFLSIAIDHWFLIFI